MEKEKNVITNGSRTMPGSLSEVNMSIPDILRRVEKICRMQQVQSLYLFGSYAKGTNTRCSDIDIVVSGVQDKDRLEEALDDIDTLKKIDVFYQDEIHDPILQKEIQTYAKKYTGRFESYCRNLMALEEARKRDPSDSFVLSGTISKFSLTFDLAWKLMKDVLLEDYGITNFATGSPRETLRTAAANDLVSDDRWLLMLRLRNNLTHDYDGIIAINSFSTILEEYLPMLEQFRDEMEVHMQKENEEQ